MASFVPAERITPLFPVMSVRSQPPWRMSPSNTKVAWADSYSIMACPNSGGMMVCVELLAREA